MTENKKIKREREKYLSFSTGLRYTFVEVGKTADFVENISSSFKLLPYHSLYDNSRVHEK